MRPLALAFALLAAALSLSGSSAAQEPAADAPLIRMRDGHGSDLLVRLDPRTLQQVGRPLRTFRSGSDLRISPDGTKLAYADGARPRGRGARIHFVDLARWRSMGVARVGRHGWLTVGWVSPDRVVAIADAGLSGKRLIWVDARSRKVVASRAVSGWSVNAVPVPGGLAVALGPGEGTGPLRILLLDPSGGVRAIPVDAIEAGADYDERTGRVLTPAVTVDRDGGRIYVVAANRLLVAELDIASGAVSYHSLGAAASKGNIAVWWRHAVWAGDGRIALTGDHWPRPGRRGLPNGPVPFGVRMIDTRTWTISTLDRRPDTMHVGGSTVLAAGTRWFDGGRRTRSTGLLGFDETGRRAFTRFRGRPVVLLGSRGERGYVWVRPTRTTHIIDLADGRTLDTVRGGRRAPFLISPTP